MPSRQFKRKSEQFKITYTPNPGYKEINYLDFYEQGELTSFGHPYQLLGKSNGDIGGPFVVGRRYTDGGTSVSANSSFYNFNGVMIPNASTNNWPSITPYMESNNAIYAKGASAIARTLPTNPNSDLATAFGELKKDGIPSMIGSGLFRSKARDFRSYGSEYLNVEFGWKPFVSDIMKTADSVQNSEKILSQYRKDHGRRVKRSFRFPDVVDTTVTDMGMLTPLPALASGLYQSGGGSTGKQIKITIATKRTWFRGCYTYFVPVGDSQYSQFMRYASEAKKLYGIRLTPDVLWNLAPWSWAVDWFGNVGDVIHNASAFSQDGLVMHYGYIMQHIRVVEYITHDGVVFNNGHKSGPLNMIRVNELKQRWAATPYGFGLNPATFTGRQQSIIAALGLSSVPSRRH